MRTVLQRQIQIGTLHALMMSSPIMGSPKGRMSMFVTANPLRQVAVSFAGALIATLLFISAAIGPLPIA